MRLSRLPLNLFVLVGALVFASIQQVAQAATVTAGEPSIIQNLLPTVVNVSVKKDDAAASPTAAMAAGADLPKPSTNLDIKGYVGSGFIVDPSGLIVTNYHVVENAFEVRVMLFDGTRLPAKVMSATRIGDLALLKVEAGHPLQAIQWGDSDKLQVGDQVFAAGNPFGIGLSVSAGIVSGLNRDIQDSPYDDFIQTDATINHGNSGGPLFDMQGKVVGVDSTIISPSTGSAGIGFAIPANSAHFLVNQLRTYGWVRPSWIGVKLQQVTPEIAEALGMKNADGAIVAWVLPDGPAMKAGLAIGDIVLMLNGKAPTDERALLRDIASSPVGDTLTLGVRHEGAEHQMSITTAQWPRDQWDTRDAPMTVQRPKIVIPPNLGLTLSTVPADQRPGLGLEDGLSGVLVTAVAPDDDPSQRNLKSGDVILRVQDNTVATPEAVQAGIEAARADNRDFVLMLVLPKVKDSPGPKWVALRIKPEA